MNYKILTTTLLLSGLTACGSDGESSSNDDNQYFGEFPYDYPKYQDALDNANLQQNDIIIKSAGNFDGFSNTGFYINSSSNWLTFDSNGLGNNSQLRFTHEFSVDDEDFYRLSAAVLPSLISEENTLETVNEVEPETTLLQIDNTDGYAPLLRITWYSGIRNDHSNSYWAIVNSSNCTESEADSSSCYSQYYLADYDATNVTKFDILIEDSSVTINADEENIIDKLNVSDWNGINNYFTAGTHNQDVEGNNIDTNISVQYKTLTYNTNIPIADLDASAVPSDNFELVDWYLSVPTDIDNSGTADSIKEDDLNDGYEDEFFYTADDGGMVFKCPIDGEKTSTNTSYTRTELREMLRQGNTNIDTQGVNKNNWVFSSTSSSAQNDAGGVDGILEATVSVNAVTTTGDSSERGRVIIGQIHANDDEPIRLYYRLLKGHDKGSLYFAHEPRTGSEKWITLIGSKNDNAGEPSDGIALNEKFYYKIKVQGNLLIVTIKRNYKDDITKTWDMSASGYDDEDQYMYFKAGVYNQNKSGDNDDFVQATFYYLDNQHTGYEE